MLYGHYVKMPKGAYLHVHSSMQPTQDTWTDTFFVTGKRQARSICTELGAKPWNF
jgi:hypothetical protein